MRKLILLSFIILLADNSFSQRNVRDTIIGTPWIAVHYGANWAQADLAERYGFINHLGVMGGYKTDKNWFYGIDGNFMFGNNTNFPGIFDHLRDSQGNITDINGDIGKAFIYMRGFNANFTIGKVFPVLSPNKNSGIFVHAGVGIVMHKLRIETQDHVIPQLELEYRRGYDRLTMGPNTHQFVGYAFMANSGVLNFYGGFYAQQGYTTNRRNVFFDQPEVPVSKDTRFDMQIGLKVGWFIPVYKRQPKDYYFN